MPLHGNPTHKQVERARRFRKNMSAAESLFWQLARNHQLGFEIRRQYPVGSFVLDFFCREAKLAIEFDGEQHDPERDRARDAALRDEGIETIRVPNREFFRLDKDEPYKDWIEEIVRTCERRSGRPAFPHPQPPPRKRRGGPE